MLQFRHYIPESIVDPVQATISPQIFFEPESESPKLKPKAIEQIESGLKQIEKAAPIKDYELIGSILTRRYTDEADLDVNVLVDASEEELKAIRKSLTQLNGKTVPGTKHPVNYFVVNDLKDFKRKNSLADGEFDVKKNQFIRKPILKDFDVKKYWSQFEKAAADIEDAKDELEADLIDYEYLKNANKAQAKFLQKKVKSKLEELETTSKELSDLYEKIKQDRRDAFDRPLTAKDIKEYGEKNRLPENVLYKLLEKYHYMNFLHKVEEILGDDEKLSPSEADELAKLVLDDD